VYCLDGSFGRLASVASCSALLKMGSVWRSIKFAGGRNTTAGRLPAAYTNRAPLRGTITASDSGLQRTRAAAAAECRTTRVDAAARDERERRGAPPAPSVRLVR
jgi:hypothetical protein